MARRVPLGRIGSVQQLVVFLLLTLLILTLCHVHQTPDIDAYAAFRVAECSRRKLSSVHWADSGYAFGCGNPPEGTVEVPLLPR
uniref:Secreted protein n=1 Tax=Oryza punctata TaxID=4537 RepID=A0A0E0MKR0_ORYPU